MSFWNDLLRGKAEDWLFHPFTQDQVPNSHVPTELIPGEDYTNIWLRSARVVNVRSGLSKFYGAVHSYISVPLRGQGEPGEVTTVTTPSMLKNVDPRRIDRVVNINHRLLGPVPTVAGDIKIEIGLFSVEGEDLVAPYLGLLETVSGLAGVGFIKGALPFINPIKEGINGILHGQGDTLLEIGLSATFNPLKSGYYLVMRVPKDEIDATKLKLDTRDWKVIGQDGKSVKDFPYLVLEIAGTKKKDDWQRIPELLTQYNLIRDAVRRNNSSDAKKHLEVFALLAATCYDLTKNDADRLITEVRTEVERVLGQFVTHAVARPSVIREFAAIPLYP